MNTVELLQFSLGVAFDVLGQVTADLTQEQADWLPPGTALPIGALYWHAVSYSDELVHDFCVPPFRFTPQQEFQEAKLAKQDLGMGQTPLRHSAGWQEKVILALPPENPEDPFWDLRAVPRVSGWTCRHFTAMPRPPPKLSKVRWLPSRRRTWSARFPPQSATLLRTVSWQCLSSGTSTLTAAKYRR